jgi:hypothetical protein
VTHGDLPPASRGHQLILANIGRRCIEELEVESATIALATGPQSWVPAYASSPRAGQLEQYAFTVGEGPCFDTLRDHIPVVAPDLTLASAIRRWPAWTAQADELRVRSVAAFPIQAGAIAAGVLTVYSDGVGKMDSERFATAQRLADIAFLGLLDLMAGLREPEAADIDLSVLLRADVHRAAGMVMAQADLTIEQALVRLRAYAFSAGRSLTEVAADVLSRQLRFEPEDHAAE